MRGKFGLGVIAGVLLASVMVASMPRDAIAESMCGARDNPCPMQKWMRTKLAAPNAAGDMPALAAALEKAAQLSPDPSWNGNDPDKSWDAISKIGAAAARANDPAKVKAACKACHDAWKAKYKDAFRTRPVAG
jgi:hypothetical protein